ncbi:MAG: FAD-dependent oxidoreductase [Saprospiraceae bacterium]|nr:FAD-dependent oxidoreductase [Saprospiraceae bacterium]
MTKSIHIIGGGIIGLCSAWYLNKKGVDVTVIDQGNFKDGTSYGNAGMIVPSHFVPMAAPGVMTQGLKWLLDRTSPFFIRPRMSADLLKWIWHFYRSSTEPRVREVMPLLYEFNALSRDLYRDISGEIQTDFGFRERGLLMLYNTIKQEKKEVELAEKAFDLGVDAQLLGVAQIKGLEPDMEINVRGGIYFPGDAHLTPGILMKCLKEELHQTGVRFIEDFAVREFEVSGNNIHSVLNGKGNRIPVKQLLVTAGAWAAELLKGLGVKILLQGGKGYSFTLKNKSPKPGIPTILSEAKVAITPMGRDLRIGGTLEISGLTQTVSEKRINGIIECIPDYYKNLDIKKDAVRHIWTGFRPCTPDGLPYLGKLRSIDNLFLGTGHGMMGLSLGAASGLILSQIMTGEKPAIDIAKFTPERF